MLVLWLNAGPLFSGPRPPAAGEQEPPRRASQDDRTPLTLLACYSLTLARSEADLIRREDIRLADARYRSAMGAFVPELGLFATKVRNDEVAADRDPARDPARDLESGRVPGDPAGYLLRHTATTNPFFAGAFLRVPLFNGFRNYYDAGALRLDTERYRLLRKRAREVLYQDLAGIFFQTLQYQAVLHVLDEEARALESRVSDLARDRRLGRARPSELLTARADLAASRAESENTKGILAVSRELLAFFVGRPEKEWRLVDEVGGPPAVDLERFLRGVNERKDVLAALNVVRSRRNAVRSARAGHLPSVSLEGSYYLKQAPDTGRDWTVSLRLELPLFSGGRTSAGTDAGLAQQRASELDLSRVRRSAAYEVRAAYSEYVAGVARSLLLEEAAELYEEAYAAQRTEFRYGLVRNLEVLDSLRRLHQARRAALQVKYATKVAQVRLHVAAGASIPEFPAKVPLPPVGGAR